MLEPLLNIVIPNDTAMQGRHHRAGDAAETVLLLQQVFDNHCAQQNLAEVCRLCATQAGVRLVAVEGADDEVVPSNPPRSIRQLIDSASQVSAGVLHLQSTEPDLVDVWGVDDMELNFQSQQAMIRVMNNGPVRDSAFVSIRDLAQKAQARCYGPELASLRGGMLSVYQQRQPVSKQVAMLVKAADSYGVDLRAFPLVRRYDEIIVKERNIQSAQVQRQTVEFMTRLQRRLFDWFKPAGRNEMNVDLQRAKPIFEYWMERTGMTADELDRNAEQRGIEATVLECKQWLETSVIEEARREGVEGKGTPHVFYEEMMRLALRLGVDYFDLREFREMIAINRDMQAIKRGLVDEIAGASRAVVQSAGRAEATEFLEIEDRLDIFYRALRLEVPPGEAEAADIEPDKFHALLDKLRGLAGASGADSFDAKKLDGPLEDAATFLRHSKKRSQHMANRTLELMRERGDDRAILVAGGFHERAITRAFEDSRGVSWSVLAPTPDLSEVRRG